MANFLSDVASIVVGGFVFLGLLVGAIVLAAKILLRS